LKDSLARRNKKKSRTGFVDEDGAWYILDNAATIMPAASNRVNSSLFRVSATLDAPVHLPSLEAALARTVRRFPYFALELHRGFFWYYLEPHTAPIHVVADAESPCQDFNVNKKGTCLLRVRAQGRRVACEFSHTLTDGTGGFRFLKNLLAEYFRLRGVEANGADPDLYDLDARPDPEEYEDSYNRYFSGQYPIPEACKRAFQIRSPLLEPFNYRVTTGIVPVAPALELAKSYGATLTELVTAVFIDAFQSMYFDLPERERRRRSPFAAIEVPVNMRKFYPTKSNRNFSLFVLITQDFRLGRRDFREIVERAHHQMRFEVDERNIARQISRNVGGTRNMAVRLVPLVLKDFFARMLFSALGESLISSFISNIGAVSLPEGPAEHVERFDFFPAPSLTTLTNASMLSWKGNLYIGFGSLARSRELERLVLTRLRKLGLPVKVECNLPIED
jgi:NRPS condensation-like uncharacterized protein